MVVFYFFLWFPAGFIFHYLLYGRGTIASWWIIIAFFLCAHWPSPEKPKFLETQRPKILRETENTKPVETERKRLPAAVMYRKCSFYLCGNYEKEFKSFKICRECRAPFCSRQCQIADWQTRNHKSHCKRKNPQSQTQ